MEDIEDTNLFQFENRHGKDMTVARMGLLEFVMGGIDMFYMRYSKSDDGNLIMFDPSGGPYITAEHGNHPGTNMGFFREEWKDLIIESIEWGIEEGTAILKCYSKRPVEWVDIK
jgi:hypothetical protein